MRTLQVTAALSLLLLVVVTYQPFRDVPRGRAAERALLGPPAALGALAADSAAEAVYVIGTLQPARDVRRERPVEATAGWTLGLRQVEYALAPGTWLRDADGEIRLEGTRFALAGAPTDYPYGGTAAVYGAPRSDGLEVWALGRDRAALVDLAARQTALLRWPGLLVGLVFAAAGYLLALAASYLLAQVLLRRDGARPGVAGLALSLYLMIGFGLLGSAWAMLWPMVAGALLAAGAAAVLARRRRLSRPPAAQ